MTLPAPVHIHQLDGTAWGGSACMGAAGAMALDAYTRGAVRVGQAAIRAAQDDKKGGIGLNDVATAWRRGWGLTFTHGPADWTTIRRRLSAGDGVVVTVNYAAMRTWRAPGSTFTGAHALYLRSLATIGAGTPDGVGRQTPAVVVHDPLRRAVVTVPESVVRLAYTGGAGWGKGTYAGAPASSGSAGDGSAGKTMAQYLGVSPDAIFDAAMLDRFVNKVRDDTGAAGAYGASFLRTYYGTQLGKRAGDVVYLHNADGTPAGDGAGVLVGSLGQVFGDSLARGALVLGLVALGLLGVWLTFREPLAVVLPSPVRGLAR